MSEATGASVNRAIPAGWQWVTLEQVFSSITDGDHSAPPQVEEGIPFLVIGNVRSGAVDFSDVRFVPRDYYESVGESRKPRKGDLLYTVTGSFGIPVLVDSDREFCVQRHIAILKAAPVASVRYLSFGLATTEAYSQAAEAATGTAQKTVGLQRLRQFRVPLAPASEQERIVEAIESYFTRLDDAVATLERVERNLKRYRASVLKSAVEGGLVPTEAALAKQEGRDYEPASVLLERILTGRRRRWSESGKKGKYQEPTPPDTTNLPDLPEGWCWATVHQLGESLTGTTPSTTKPMYYGGDLPFFKPTDLNAGYSVTSARDFLSEEGARQARVLPAGSVLVTCIGATIGKTGLARVECATNQQINALVPHPPLRGVFYLFWFFTSPSGQAGVIENASSTTMPILNKSRFERLAVPVPPLREQVRIVAEVERLISLTAGADVDIERTARKCGRLRQSILKWAFEGKLADQDPSYEPASVLLERIKAERETAKPAKTARPQRDARKKIRA